MPADAAAGSLVPRSSVAISFGSPASESGVGRLDLNQMLVTHPQATFVMRVSGRAMRAAGIDDGDLALVDRAISALHGHIVIAIVDDEFVCRRLHRRGAQLRLEACDPAHADIVPGSTGTFEVWGVVTHAIKSLTV